MTQERLEAIRARTALELRTQYEDGLYLLAEVDRLTVELKKAEQRLEVKLPCDVSLPPRTTISVGCTIETVVLAIENRVAKVTKP